MSSKKDLKKKLDDAIARAKEAKKKTKLTEVNSLKVVDDYKKSAAFDKEVTKISLYCYEYNFNDYKAKVA